MYVFLPVGESDRMVRTRSSAKGLEQILVLSPGVGEGERVPGEVRCGGVRGAGYGRVVRGLHISPDGYWE